MQNKIVWDFLLEDLAGWIHLLYLLFYIQLIWREKFVTLFSFFCYITSKKRLWSQLPQISPSASRILNLQMIDIYIYFKYIKVAPSSQKFITCRIVKHDYCTIFLNLNIGYFRLVNVVHLAYNGGYSARMKK